MGSSKQSSLGIGQIAVIAVLVVILIATCVWAVSAWNASSGVAMGKHGWIALGLGTFFSLLIGCGLMALMFFSSRSEHDETADPFRRKQQLSPGKDSISSDENHVG